MRLSCRRRARPKRRSLSGLSCSSGGLPSAGSAEVFLARPKLGNLPAPRLVVKRLLRSVREGGEFDALEREAELHRAVKHANVVDVYGAGMVGDEPYLRSSNVDGVDLYRLLRRAESEQRRFPPGLAAHIAREVAEALTAVHGARDNEGNVLHIVHRATSRRPISCSPATVR